MKKKRHAQPTRSTQCWRLPFTAPAQHRKNLASCQAASANHALTCARPRWTTSGGADECTKEASAIRANAASSKPIMSRQALYSRKRPWAPSFSPAQYNGSSELNAQSTPASRSRVRGCCGNPPNRSAACASHPSTHGRPPLRCHGLFVRRRSPRHSGCRPGRYPATALLPQRGCIPICTQPAGKLGRRPCSPGFCFPRQNTRRQPWRWRRSHRRSEASR
mmetsp:Transcript_65801/g.183298  ORF Transcript_65801/g.183298 Transcript_65801/m.183298 type:complete len:220 (-) Transcript_65801:875-1534(-)